MVVLLGACTAPPKVPFTHTLYWRGELVPGYLYPVRTGDTLASIAQHYECDLGLLSRMNNVNPYRALGANSRIFVPRQRGGFPSSYYVKERNQDRTYTRQSPAKGGGQNGGAYPPPGRSQPRVARVVSTPRPTPPSRPTPRKPQNPTAGPKHVGNAPAFQWPADGVLTSLYNKRANGKRRHMGIDIANSKRGTVIRAAYHGRVLYSGGKAMPSMGNMILIEHRGDWVTVYSHNERLLVKEGENVRTGQVIAIMGATGRATGPHLHFEIRRNADTSVDPLQYLPKRG